jgi:hypothetical protein
VWEANVEDTYLWRDPIAIDTYFLKETIQALRAAPQEDVPTEIRMRYRDRVYTLLISGGKPMLAWLSRTEPPLDLGEFDPVEDWGPEECDTIDQALVEGILAILTLGKREE